MAQTTPTITGRILEHVRVTPDCGLDDLVQHCEDFTWHEVFLEVNRLKLAGQLLLTSNGVGAFTMRVAEHKLPVGTVNPPPSVQSARSTPDWTLEGLLASCPDLLGGQELPELHRLNQSGRVQLIHVDANSFTIKLLKK